MSLTHTRLWVAARVMRYYNSVPLLGAVQTTSLLVVMLPIYNLISAEKTPLKKFNPWFPQNAPSKKGKNVRFIKISSYNFNKLATGSWWFFPCGYVIIAILTGPFLDFTNRWSLAELGS